ncbi:MAG: TonB-dependent receptor plug domain-containing protein [Myxococcaceae bacterium]|jgi:outer membrane receptor protein involved in Fe transport|nr:TonB-dependent receptor plug domain-containing protein [Myxococcaceae bacterium]
MTSLGPVLALVVSQLDGGVADVEDLSLEALLDTPVEVATRDARTSTLEAPNVVLVLTRDDIVASGARDLLEVLQLVPGFSFHQDVGGVVGAAFRNLWAHEGKLLVMLDGQEVNELLYTTSQFGHRVLAHVIERVELIRGPGSALYGGTAELAVVNVITRQGRTLKGGEVMGRLAGSTNGLHDVSFGAAAGSQRGDLEWSLTTTVGEGRRTLGTYTDFSGNGGSLAQEPLDPMFLSAFLSKGPVRARVMLDDQRIGARVGYGEFQQARDETRFRTLLADVQADLQPASTLTLRPRLQARVQTPWQTTNAASPFFFDKSVVRALTGLYAAWAPVASFTLSGGLDGFVDHAWLNDPRLLGLQTDFRGRPTVSYLNVATWLQAQWSGPVNITAGGRLEWNQAVGVNVAPRVAITRQLDRVSLKALYGGAFRNPGIENLNLTPTIRPERTHVVEAEVGIPLGEVAYVSANGFYTLLTSPIIYGLDGATGEESYRNGGAISTAGAEALLRLRGRRGSLTVTGALATPVVTNDVDTYLVPGAARPTLLGMPLVKATAFGRVRATEHVSFGGSAVFFSGRQALVTASEVLDGRGVVSALPAALLLTVWAGVDDVVLPGLSAQLGVGNLLDANVAFVQPYDGGQAPVPGRGRELYLRLSYAFGEATK